MTTIVEAQTEAEIRNCFPVLVQLREHLQAETFVEQVRRLQSVSGYRLFFVQHQEEVVAVAGVRVVENFAWRRHLYVDDWVTDQAHRSSGHGEELFRFLIGLAQEEGCQEFHLDSGVQRFDAHRFYLRHRLRISSHHFSLDLER